MRDNSNICLEDGVRRQEAAGEEASNILGDQLHQVRVGGCYGIFFLLGILGRISRTSRWFLGHITTNNFCYFAGPMIC